MFCKNSVLKNFVKTGRKKPVLEIFFRPATLLKKRLRHKCFPVNFAKFLRTLFILNSYGGCFFQFSLDSRRRWWKYISELVMIWFITAFLLLVGTFVFIFGEQELSIASRRLLSHLLYILFMIKKDGNNSV